MIGVRCQDSERETVQEFFELFKTPWAFVEDGQTYEAIISTCDSASAVHTGLIIYYSAETTEFDTLHGVTVEPAVSGCFVRYCAQPLPIYGRLVNFLGKEKSFYYREPFQVGVAAIEGYSAQERMTLRVGYDLFQEIAFLLEEGQPPENALVPTVELHIALLREWILGSGIPLVEIPPLPWGFRFMAGLTHDVDFVGIRLHKFDHTMWGFVYRAIIGSLMGLCKGTGSFDRLVRNWCAVLSLPLVYLGIRDDFWAHFDAYAGVDKGVLSTFFLIPFRGRVGDVVRSKYPERRATRYDIDDVREQVRALDDRGFEIGVHGIDAWHSVDKGKQERARIVGVTGQKNIGVRMHWLCFDCCSPAALEEAGFDYDATCGYNETIGYKAGTTQVFKPFGATRLLELPLHVQDTSLFYPRRMGLTNAQAWGLCERLMDVSDRFGGVLTVSWHERSLAPERLWGAFYAQLLQELQVRGVWLCSAREVVQWFRIRRSLVFEDCSFAPNAVRLHLRCQGGGFNPPLTLRVHRPPKGGSLQSCVACGYIDLPYTGESLVDIPLD